ncbi:MAG TPA: tetratricopeptide repeat protein [Candidatus Binatus sp.]|uniref:tetratricopeptide repeat protein n=1 Tax=Candidatus Binatus sp. TaxID=2811406 RepID=UPI002F3EA46F
MRFCPQCGAPLLAGAKFCVECGRALDVAAPGAGDAGTARAPARGGRNNITTAFVFVFVTITLVGLGVAAWIMMKTPEVVREQIASVPPGATVPSGAPALNPGAAAPQQNVPANPAAGGSQGGSLPAGHPTIELPTEARSFVDKIERDAIAKPKDVTAWNKFGAVSMRAAMFDQTYYGKAEDAYGHVLKLEPDNLDALRGIGDIDYDKQHYDEAIAAYEHYLKKKPDDPEVRTDLGTMYLYTGNADQAVVQYKKAIAAKPGFFQAYYNMGIAYAQMNKPDDAAATLKQAIALAPDDTARDQVKALMAKLSGAPAASASMQAASAKTPAAAKTLAAAKISATPAAAVAAKSPAAASSPAASAAIAAKSSASPAAASTPSEDDFHDAVETMVRGLPVAGPKVTSVEWPDKLKAKVLMDSFPMDQMPPFAKAKFLTDLKAGIDSAKKDNNISSPVEVNIVDGASGSVMETITQ